MAIKYWLGTVAGFETDYNQVNNWDPVNVPINGDDIIFSVRGGNKSCLVNLNQSAVAPASVRVTSNYTGSIGASGNTLRYNYLSDTPGLLYEGQGIQAWFEFVHAANPTTVIVMGTGGGASALHLDAALGAMTIEIFAGKGITIDAGAYVTMLTLYGTTTEPTVTVESGALVASFIQYGGVLTSPTGAVSYSGYGGSATFTNTATIGTCRLYQTMSITWNSSGAITTLDVHNTSSFNASASPGFTIGTLWLHDKSILDLENGAGTIIVTSPILCYDRGAATLRIEAGRTLTLNAL